jgi:hypothetical protein
VGGGDRLVTHQKVLGIFTLALITLTLSVVALLLDGNAQIPFPLKLVALLAAVVFNSILLPIASDLLGAGVSERARLFRLRYVSPLTVAAYSNLHLHPTSSDPSSLVFQLQKVLETTLEKRGSAYVGRFEVSGKTGHIKVAFIEDTEAQASDIREIQVTFKLENVLARKLPQVLGDLGALVTAVGDKAARLDGMYAVTRNIGVTVPQWDPTVQLVLSPLDAGEKTRLAVVKTDLKAFGQVGASTLTQMRDFVLQGARQPR